MNFLPNQNITADPNFKSLYETNVFVLGYVFEDAWLFDKITTEAIFIGDFYGDPLCGLIGPENDWAFVGGEHIVIWRKGKEIQKNKNKEIAWTKKVRLISAQEIEFLVDPLSMFGATWQLDFRTLNMLKIRNFKITGNYEEDVDW